jgi:uncharacterized protein YndB with AHSA1/START domain
MIAERTLTAPAESQSITFSREFDAPASRVFAAHVDPELVKQWIGPPGTTLDMRVFEPHTGGSWSYVVRGSSGQWAFFGSFHEVSAPTRLVQTWEYEGDPGNPSMEVLTFVDLPGDRSRIDGHSIHLTVADRDAMIRDFEGGRDSDFERLDELLATGMPAA